MVLERLPGDSQELLGVAGQEGGVAAIVVGRARPRGDLHPAAQGVRRPARQPQARRLLPGLVHGGEGAVLELVLVACRQPRGGAQPVTGL